MFTWGLNKETHNRNGFYKLKNFSLSPGIEPDSLSSESLIYTTRPPSYNSKSEYVVYMNVASAAFGVKF